jgi:mannose-6-phosphate isomerase
VTRGDLVAAIEERSTLAMRDLVVGTVVEPGEAWLIRPGIPHYIGSEVLFIEIQQPSDYSVVPEHWTIRADELDATMGLGWDLGLDAFDFDVPAVDGRSAVARACQRPSEVRSSGENLELDLLEPDAHELFDVRRLEIASELELPAGRFSINVVTGGDGHVEGGWGRLAIRRGEAFVLAASVAHRFSAGSAPLQVHRCVGPSANGGSPS